MVDDAINIRGLKLYAIDHAGHVPVYREGEKPAPATGKKVAIVGGGPSGISAAYYLGMMGHSVEIFEQRKRLGGMLRYGIPSYRLPREVLHEEIETLLTAGTSKYTKRSQSAEKITRSQSSVKILTLYISQSERTRTNHYESPEKMQKALCRL